MNLEIQIILWLKSLLRGLNSVYVFYYYELINLKIYEIIKGKSVTFPLLFYNFEFYINSTIF